MSPQLHWGAIPSSHDDVIKWKHFPRNWPFVQGIHRSPVNSPQRPVTRSFDIFLICVWINDWVNNREAGDLRRYRAHYDVIVVYRFTSQPREVPCHYPSTNEPTPNKKMPFLNYDMLICSEQNKKHRWLLILWAIYNTSQCIGGIVLI